MEVYINFLAICYSTHLSIDIYCSLKLKWNIIFYFEFTLFCYFLFFPSLSFLHLSLFSASPSLLSSSTDPQTLPSSSKTHRRSAWVQLPQSRRRRPTFGHRPDPFQPLFSIFGVSVLCFRLCLCFGFVFRLCVSGCAYVSAYVSACVSDLCFGLGGFVFQAWVSVCGFDVWVTRFGFGGFRCLVGVDFVVVGLFCGVLWVCWCCCVGA